MTTSPTDPVAPPASESMMQDAWDEFRSFIKRRGDRVTETRRIVLDRALQRGGHFQADELAKDLSRGTDRVSRGTVYRTLALLVEAGLVREIRDRDTHVHYEPVYNRPHHEHMICESCGAFIEFDDEAIHGLVQQACDRMGFVEKSHRLVVFGTCKECQ
jgi:Fur family ferric uptake transcriptional regulator